MLYYIVPVGRFCAKYAFKHCICEYAGEQVVAICVLEEQCLENMLKHYLNILKDWSQTYGKAGMLLGYAMSICEGCSWIV